MEKYNKKVICINADEDKDYEQIIFVMKDEKRAHTMKEKGRINFVLEAERIINRKLNMDFSGRHRRNAVLKKDGSVTQLVIKKSSKFDIWLNICMMFACLFLTAALIFIK